MPRTEVPLSSQMSDETFLNHWNKRHRKSDSTLASDLVYSSLNTSYGSLRQFHILCHKAEAEGGTIQFPASGKEKFTPSYDHQHADNEEDE